MKKAVEQETVNLSRDRLAALPRLPRGERHRDDDVSQEASVPAGEREYVRRFVFAPVTAVEAPHPRIAAEKNGDLLGAASGNP